MKIAGSFGFSALILIGLFLVPTLVCAQPTLSINDVNIGFEGNGGVGSAAFTVTRSGTGQSSSVQFDTSNGTATGGNSCSGNSDYLNFAGGALSFSANETTKTIQITICGDTRDEADETFFINLHTPSGAAISDGQGQGTIVDDDNAPSLRINDTSVIEGNAGVSNAAFTVTLSQTSGQNVSVTFATANDTATGGASCAGTTDFVNSNNVINFAAGVTSQPVAIGVCGDTTNESTERFRVNLSSPVNATIQDNTGFGTITTDDIPTLSIADVTVTEPVSIALPRNAVFTLVLSSANPAGATVHFGTVNGTAVVSAFKTCDGNGDYVLRGGNAEFSSTQTTRTITVPICHDTRDEPNETFQILLSNPVGMNAPDLVAVGTIVDND